MDYAKEIVKLLVAMSQPESNDDASIMEAYGQFVNSVLNNLTEVTDSEDVLGYIYVYLQTLYRKKSLLTSQLLNKT